MLFAHPLGIFPREWLVEQCRRALWPGYLEAHLSVLRASGLRALLRLRM